jgi:predicted dehydrogenase
MGNVYKLGVVGLGEGRSIMSAALQSKQWELHKVCDLNPDICEKRAAEFDFHQWTTSYDELLSDPEIDVIAIYTPDQLHLTHVRQAVEAGKHVVCTKPLIPSLDGAAELLDLVNSTDRKVFVGQSSRFFEPMIHQRADFEKGRHGEIHTVETHYITDGRWFLEKAWSRQKGFSWMYGFMIHAVDLARWYLPNISEVVGFGFNSTANRGYGVDSWDSMRFLLRDSEGRIAQVSGTYTVPTLGQEVEPSMSCIIRGAQGVSRAEYSNLSYFTNFTGEGKTAHSYDEKKPYYFRFEGNSHHAGEYQNYIEYFADCLDSGETPLPNATEAIHTLAIMQAMERSIHGGGQLVKISEVLEAYGLSR